MTTPLNVYQRINEIRKNVAYARKEKEVSTGGSGKYKVVTHDQITALVRNELIEHCVIVVPSVLESSVVDTGTKTSTGTPIIRYQGRFEIVFVNGDRPADEHERIVVAVETHANDQGDKAPGKALSMATKNAMLKLLSIETGEDEEARTEPYEERTPITEQQAADLTAKIVDTVRDQAKFAEWMRNAVGTDIVDQIPAAKLELVTRQLDSIKAAREAVKAAGGDQKPAARKKGQEQQQPLPTE